MKKIMVGVVIGILMLCVACQEEKVTPKVLYEKPNTEVKPVVKADSSQIKVADLPILMDGTKYLIHAVGDVRLYESSSSKYGSSTTSSVSYSLSNYNKYELTGYLSNLKFQHIDSTQVHTLTDKPLEIQTVTYLEEISRKNNKGILVYSLADADTNRDGKVNANDIQTLYISREDGSNFVKLSPEMQEFIDWNTVDVLSKLYFRTIEDINKNGSFDKKDKVHYYYVDLKKPSWEVVEYNPFE